MEKTISIPITLPQQWDPEHPRLYTLTSTISSGDALETVSTRVGFRQVEVRGNQMFVNGHTVKLHGVCRHEIDPLRGRSLAGNEWDKDAEMFAHANVNFVRTSHYPPAEEFLDARIDSNEKTPGRMREVEVKGFVASTKKTPCAGVFKNERKEPSGSVGTSPSALPEKGEGRPEPVAGRGLCVVRI